jgi:multidrug efflux pump subunit AcrB
MNETSYNRGAIAWMARNSVAANLLMMLLIVGGIVIGLNIQQEVFPEFDLDFVQVLVPYPGASPAEVEQGILLAIEDGVRGLDGVKRVTSNAFEGNGVVTVELLIGTNANKAQQDIQNAVDRITSFPQEAERPIVSLLTRRREVISLMVYGDHDQRVLHRVAEQVRDELLQDPKIVLVERSGVPPLEISIEVPMATLRAYNLTLEEIANQVGRGAVELPAGGVKTRTGEVLLRTAERRDYGKDFADIPILSRADGTQILLGDIARIIDGFEDTDEAAFYRGKPAIVLKVYRIGDQTPVEIAEAVKVHVAEIDERLPPGINVTVWRDWSEIFKQRMGLLIRNARTGLVLVLLLLGLFLEVRLAFWVTMGIPISILGSLLILPFFGVSINMVSLFGFIVTIGIVVDDAIVVGENVYENREAGMDYLPASIRGAQWIAWPVTFSVLTNMVAFIPIFFVPGVMGKIFRSIPAVVTAVFFISLVESLFVLPAHLGHLRRTGEQGFWAVLRRIQKPIGRTLENAIIHYYRPALTICLRNRYLTMSVGLAILVITIGFDRAGHLEFTFFPKIDSDRVYASVNMPYGTAVEDTKEVQASILDAAGTVLDRHGGEKITRGIATHVGSARPTRGSGGTLGGGGHLGYVQVYLVPADERKISAADFVKEWREEVGEIPGPESLTYTYSLMIGSGPSIDVELSHMNVQVLEQAATELADALRSYQGVRDIDDGFSLGKPQLDFRVKPEARSLGITASMLGSQVRSAFYGAEALRQQRGREEVKVMVRLPEEERKSEYNVEELLILTPGGGEMPLREAATVTRGRAYTEINRADARRVLNVTGDVIPGVANATKVLADLESGFLPELMARHPGLSYSMEGQQRWQRESLDALQRGLSLALIVIYAMLAVAFGSYIQPVIVMAAIPFGLVGASLGHLIMGYDLSLMSMMGMVALSGVVVNDSLVLIHATNENRQRGRSAMESVTAAGIRRFRPILLTSLTTFCGLAPMIFETSIQAQFLIPMAISLGFGVLFVTFIALLLVPCLYLIVEDARGLFGFGRGGQALRDGDQQVSS